MISFKSFISEMAYFPKDVPLTARYKHFNAIAFDNKLPRIRVTKFKSTEAGGKAGAHVDGFGHFTPTEIKLSEYIINSPEELDKILLHEMCHIAVFMTSTPRDGHGPVFLEIRKHAELKTGIKIPVSEDLTDGWTFTDNLKTREFLVLIFTPRPGVKDDKLMMVWDPKGFKKGAEMLLPRLDRVFAKNFTVDCFTSENKNLFNYPLIKKMGKGFTSTVVSPESAGLFNRAMEGAEKIPNIHAFCGLPTKTV